MLRRADKWFTDRDKTFAEICKFVMQVDDRDKNGLKLMKTGPKLAWRL
jgi:hypothetical protein